MPEHIPMERRKPRPTFQLRLSSKFESDLTTLVNRELVARPWLTSTTVSRSDIVRELVHWAAEQVRKEQQA